MQLPVVIFKTNTQTGLQKLFVTEKESAVDYTKLVRIVNTFAVEKSFQTKGLAKETMNNLLKLASTESDRKLIKFAVSEASGLSNKKVQQTFGVNASKLKTEVREALTAAEEIRKDVADIMAVREEATLRSLGMYEFSSESESDESDIETKDIDGSQVNVCWLSDSENEDDSSVKSVDDHEPNRGSHLDPDSGLDKQTELPIYSPKTEHLLLMLRENHLNWFSFVEEVRLLMHSYSDEVVNQVLIEFSHNLDETDLDDKELESVEISRQAYLNHERVIALDSTGLTDSESDDPEDWVDLNLRSEEGKKIVKKQRSIIKRMAKRQESKLIAERCLLKRKVPKRVCSVLKKFPDIGKEIEEFVQSKRCGADSWRRTGVTTFDGNIKRGAKASFRSIQAHLQTKYKTKIGYGTVVQLCVVRNKRKLSAKRYKGVAQVTCRRARKGFNLKFNPDAHFNCALYKILDKIQLEEPNNKLVLNRDDQAGFRLDTTYTHSQHKLLSVQQEVTTRTDFVNKYSSVLQCSTYLFMNKDKSDKKSSCSCKGSFFVCKESITACCRF